MLKIKKYFNTFLNKTYTCGSSGSIGGGGGLVQA